VRVFAISYKTHKKTVITTQVVSKISPRSLKYFFWI